MSATATEERDSTDTKKPVSRIKVAVYVIGVGFAILVVASGVSTWLFPHHEDYTDTRVVFDGIPVVLQVLFYIVVPVFCAGRLSAFIAAWSKPLNRLR